MNCPDIRALTGPYLDSELDVKTTADIQRHLATCPACARVFAAEQAWGTRLTAALRSGEATPAWWARIEQRVRTAAPADRPAPARAIPRTSAPNESWAHAWLWPNPRFYAGLAAVWAWLLVAHLWLPGEDALARRAPTTKAAASWQTLAERQRVMAELLSV